MHAEIGSSPSDTALERLVSAFDHAFDDRPAESANEVAEYLVCRIGGEYLGYPVRYAAGAFRLGECVPVPGCHAALAGIANARGRLLPIYSLHRLFGATPEGDAPKLVVMARDTPFDLGFLVDDLLTLVAVPHSAIHPLEQGLASGVEVLLDGHFQYQDASVFCLDITRICNELCGQDARSEETEP